MPSEFDEMVASTVVPTHMDHFGEPVTHSPVGGSGVEVTAQVQVDPAGRSHGDGSHAAERMAEFTFAKADVPDVAQGSVVTARGFDYVVDQVQDSGNGFLVAKAMAIDASLATHVVDLEAAREAEDQIGTTRKLFRAIAYGLRCSLEPVSQGDDDAGGRNIVMVRYQAFFPFLQTPSPSDLLSYQRRAEEGAELRVKYTDGEDVRYFQVESAINIAEQSRMIRVTLIEREIGYWQV